MNSEPQEKTIRGKIDSVKVIKSGESQREGKTIPWTLLAVVIGGMEFRTFDAKFQKLMGQEGEWKYKEETRTSSSGTEYVSRTLLPLPKSGTKETPMKEYDQGEVIIGMLKDLNAKVDKLLNVSIVYPKDIPEKPSKEEIPEEYEETQ